jgi:4-hydroxy-tetrahydrodipicolinate synthase
MKNGFITALGTPLTEEGRLVERSLAKEIDKQIEIGASGLLLMGSMGKEAYIMNSEYGRIVDAAIAAVDGRVPLYVGAMDNSIARVMEKIGAIGEGKRIDGIVLTVPFYSVPTNADAVNWFNTIATRSPYPIYLYDLPGVTQFKMSMKVIDEVISHPNIKGIKSANWELINAIGRKYPEAGFECFYSGLDNFDYASVLGLSRQLDGMFCCTPENTRAMYECMNGGDLVGARRYLDNILLLRDTMIANNLNRCFTAAMNILGYEGGFHADYAAPITDATVGLIRDTMKKIGEIG